MTLIDLMRRIIACARTFLLWRRRYDVLIVDSSLTSFFISVFCLLFGNGGRKLVVASYNVPRRRSGILKWLAGKVYSRPDHFFVHSRYDIDATAELYCIPRTRFSFRPYVRNEPSVGEPSDKYLFKDKRPFIMSFGCNARDYGTFFSAITGTCLNAIVVAREYNLSGLIIPENVLVFFNIPLEQCDKLVSKCLYTVFAFDGSEPSCGQISIVTSFMLSKPVICTDWIGVHDYVCDGENGLLVGINNASDVRSKMLKLAEDKELYSRLVQGTRRWTAKNAGLTALHETIDGLVTQLAGSQSQALR